MKYNIKIVLRIEKSKKNGEAPLVLRIYLPHKIGSKYEYLSTNFWLLPNQWDQDKEAVRKNVENHQDYNAILGELKQKVIKALLNESLIGNQTPENIKELIYKKKPIDFFEFARKHIALHNTINLNSRSRYTIAINEFEKFMGQKQLPMSEVTTSLLLSYVQHMINKKKKPTTINNYLVVLKMIIKKAGSRGLVNQNDYQANEIKVIQKPDIMKIQFLNEEMLLALSNLPENDNKEKQVFVDMFVFSVLTGGLRWSDMVDLKWENLKLDKKGRTILQKEIIKTSSLNYPLAVGPKALAILMKYASTSELRGYVFFKMLKINQDLYNSGELGRSKETGKAGSRCNKYLKQISKDLKLPFYLHFHCARHTFATMALRTLRIEMVSKILGHSTVKMTERYAKVLEEDALEGQECYLEKMNGLLGSTN
jgi:integrase/recombinase XerD